KTTLALAIERLGFVQADPIRAPARAQDLTLRHRVVDYRAGDLERDYAELAIEEDHLFNYGFMSRAHHALLHPRSPRRTWDRATKKHAGIVLELVRERGEVHPREVDERLSLGTVTNAWGGSSSASTHLLDEMHYRGVLRVARRDSGIRIYAPRVDPALATGSAAARADALVRLVVAKYAPLPLATLRELASRLRFGAPHLRTELKAALARAREQLPHAAVDGIDWYWPAGEDPARAVLDAPDTVRFLAPFDPVVWDRRRFEILWGWRYRFEAYTPAPKRKLGYYALPLLWREQVIGWGNIVVAEGALVTDVGYVAGHAPRDRVFKRALDAEVELIRAFLDIGRPALHV
ncbi:MAG: hypothetical protein JWM74_1328, partial [Myxococcaceae bacterium]|nr:hypothetical protein [Myxococcaceae bacterium]